MASVGMLGVGAFAEDGVIPAFPNSFRPVA